MDNISKIGFGIIGIILGVLTVPLYRWLLGEFSVFVAIPLGLLIGRIIYEHTAFGMHDARRKGREMHDLRNENHAKGRIHIDKYGHIFDPEDEDVSERRLS